ncbi:UDP-N-acetylglucosamine 1-carboxyvinyltransferase [Alphaproteobacteria bacterium endosymbiont of Tiliacea citrago]|uniref:UDP-N-acetylglucosamine 1-carboxyvinyltransferase n=1 Tax=Alphaproteobacteria bacterium endosymbiont of Tiliacea citrago TaxID=3077944 RepID=UPI00313D6BC1
MKINNSYKIIGGKAISGRIRLSGAKNFSIKALAASLLVRGESFFSNLPNNLDVQKTLEMLKSIGVQCDFNVEARECRVNTTNLKNILSDSSNTNMTTFLIASALLKYFDFISFPKMKGCNLGDRLTDFHVLAFNKFGISFYEEKDVYHIKKNKKMLGCEIELPYPSVGATETCLFLASISSGTSIIKNIAIEPEINALITLLIEMGVDVFYESDRSVRVIGDAVFNTISNGFIHGDYLEAATWAVLASITNGYIEVEGVIPELIGSFLGAYSMLGGEYKRISNDCIAFFKGKNFRKSVFLETGVFPMLRTDLQPFLAVMAALSNGTTTIIHETVYNNRLDYIEDFNKFGCDLVGFNECIGNKCRYSCNYLHSVVIKGVKNIRSVKEIKAKTVRSGMANLLLATVAKGETIISSIDIVERGYCSLFDKLKSIGVEIA